MSQTTSDETLESRVGKIEDSIEEIDRINRFFAKLGETDFHTGTKDLPTRLETIEGCISILHQSHLGHTNTDLTEFKNMHGFIPETPGEGSTEESSPKHFVEVDWGDGRPKTFLKFKYSGGYPELSPKSSIEEDEEEFNTRVSDILNLGFDLLHEITMVYQDRDLTQEEDEVCRFIAKKIASAAHLEVVG